MRGACRRRRSSPRRAPSAAAWRAPCPGRSRTSRPRGRRRSRAAAGIVRARGARQARVLVEAELLRGLDELLRAQLGAQRREDAVAGVREGDPQRAAAGLAVGVLDLDALDRRPRSGPGSVAVRLATLLSSTPASVTILNVLPGGCGRRLGDPGQREHLAACSAARPRSRRSGRRAPRPRRAGASGRSCVRTACAAARALAWRARGCRRRGRRRGCRRGARRTRARGRSGRPARRSGTPRAASSCARSGGAGPIGRRSPRRAVRDRTGGPGPWRSRCRRGPGSSRARAASSRAAASRRGAGRGRRARRASRRRGRRPCARPVGSVSVPFSVPKMRVSRVTGIVVVVGDAPGADALERERLALLARRCAAAAARLVRCLASSLTAARTSRGGRRAPRPAANAAACGARRARGGRPSRLRRAARATAVSGERGEAPGAGDSGQRSGLYGAAGTLGVT